MTSILGNAREKNHTFAPVAAEVSEGRPGRWFGDLRHHYHAGSTSSNFCRIRQLLCKTLTLRFLAFHCCFPPGVAEVIATQSTKPSASLRIGIQMRWDTECKLWTPTLLPLPSTNSILSSHLSLPRNSNWAAGLSQKLAFFPTQARRTWRRNFSCAISRVGCILVEKMYFELTKMLSRRPSTHRKVGFFFFNSSLNELMLQQIQRDPIL